jgi:TolA-binding protein
LPISILLFSAGCSGRSEQEEMRRRLDLLETAIHAEHIYADSLFNQADRALRTHQAGAEMRRAERDERVAELAAGVAQLQARIDAIESGLTPIGDAADRGVQMPPAEAAALYRQAYLDVTRGNFELAREGFEQFLQEAGASPLRDDAFYWLGECHFAAARYDEALASYRGVLLAAGGDSAEQDYLAPALLRVGLCEIELGQPGAARASLQRLQDEFPDSEEARVAAEHLRRLQSD